MCLHIYTVFHTMMHRLRRLEKLLSSNITAANFSTLKLKTKNELPPPTKHLHMPYQYLPCFFLFLCTHYIFVCQKNVILFFALSSHTRYGWFRWKRCHLYLCPAYRTINHWLRSKCWRWRENFFFNYESTEYINGYQGVKRHSTSLTKTCKQLHSWPLNGKMELDRP